jgi:hypothetical protein
MELLASTLRDVGFTLYGGPMVVWAVLLATRGRLHSVDAASIIRVFRAWGPGFGLALGACVLGALGSRYLQTGTFIWYFDTAGGRLDAGAWGFFLAMWISNIKLEIWTLDPLRKLDGEQGITDPEAYETSARRLQSHLMVHSLLVLIVAAIGTLFRY